MNVEQLIAALQQIADKKKQVILTIGTENGLFHEIDKLAEFKHDVFVTVKTL